MRVLVSGGSSGIGASASLRIAEAALARGEQPMIAVSGLTANARQDEVVRSIQSMGGKAIALTGDLGDPDVPGQLVTVVVDEFGGLDALVANAGIANPGALKDLSLEDWDGMFSVNLRGAWLLAKASYPHLKDSRGSACFTSSMSGQLPHAGSGAYSPTKAALTMLAQTLALEWAPDGIRVNVVSPGMTRTQMTEQMYLDPEVKKAREEIIPLSKIGDPMDIANVIEFLVSPLAGYVTGQDVCVDGGFSKSILSHIPGRPSSKF
ncbi:SDR family NAD(P)-dependent oxidoreductase [Streptomyces rapamycinicus]|uniref:Short-chain dehydrogenase n=2 Tax=Streptomyces rapamycinicus TaxID=1226757 RepID=A0A0A0NI53_STRRN|nr:SDR family oxidoreductase [Streptomyces rapamycinicus]AGP59247.1 short-chain dehydrogenase [Streptomyces rapamycinicus NRRL 5491]MBB4786992.1 glucose 1-dehydrogenase [Streptomyces rapamycinicus]RLV77557.1 short-chain dehydrogenase [Streptomyces rapamycinicus NRRL 5491]UTO67000.1 SDR family oxidoreductase [Streptomyces rapamycinicus]UTP34957.1 SDR family oxidoreductase [Streptomyces rapamycinicus NRRL 5491]